MPCRAHTRLLVETVGMHTLSTVCKQLEQGRGFIFKEEWLKTERLLTRPERWIKRALRLLSLTLLRILRFYRTRVQKIVLEIKH